MTSLTLVRKIRARPGIVFTALTTAAGIANWWGPDAGPVLLSECDGRVGGRFRLRFRKLDGTEHESTGEYLEVNPTRVVMTWEWIFGGEPDERGQVSRIEIDLRPIDIGTELTFTHARLQTKISAEHHEWGWGGALEKLMAYLSASKDMPAASGRRAD